MNYRGQIGVTLTWVIAFIIVFFVMLIYVAASTFIATQKESVKPDISVSQTEDIFEKDAISSFEMQQGLIKFVVMPIELNSKKIQVKNLVEDATLGNEAAKKFKELSQAFLDTNFPDKSVWLRVFVADEEIDKKFYSNQIGKYKDFAIIKKQSIWSNINTDTSMAEQAELVSKKLAAECSIFAELILSNDRKIAICGGSN